MYPNKRQAFVFVGMNNTLGAKVWQGNDWEHLIRNEKQRNIIREYMAMNPAHWADDSLYAEE